MSLTAWLLISHTTSSDEVCEAEAPSLLAEEEIVPLKRCPSLPTEECAPVKRRLASQRIRRGKKRNGHWLVWLVGVPMMNKITNERP